VFKLNGEDDMHTRGYGGCRVRGDAGFTACIAD
jgi:hypothetical protein